MTEPSSLRRIALAAMALSIGSAAAGCADVMHFLVPPPSHTAESGAERLAPDLVLEHVRLADEATVVSVAIRAGRIAKIAPSAAIGRLSARTRRLELGGARLDVPLADAHVHLAGTALLADALDARDLADAAGVCARLAAGPRQFDGDWLWVVGLRRDVLLSLSATDLHACAPDVAAVFSSPDGHGLLLTRAALALLPEAIRGLADGDGRLRAAAARRAWRALPAPRRQRIAPLLVRLLTQLSERGIGEVHAMGESTQTLRVLQELERARRLPVRVRVYLDAHDPQTPTVLREAAARGRPSRPPLVTVAGVKLWLDGTLGGRTAALRGTYTDAPGQGSLETSDAELRAWIGRCDRADRQLAVHAIGDAALGQLLRVAGARTEGAVPIRIEHAQVVGADQLAGLRGFVCSVQPLHRLEDHSFAAARLGEARVADGWRARSLQATCPLLLGSDLPISPSDPDQWRKELRGELEPSRPESERLDAVAIEDALRRDPRTGQRRRLRVGAPADLRTPERGGLLVVDGVVRIVSPEILAATR